MELCQAAALDGNFLPISLEFPGIDPSGSVCLSWLEFGLPCLARTAVEFCITLRTIIIALFYYVVFCFAIKKKTKTKRKMPWRSLCFSVVIVNIDVI